MSENKNRRLISGQRAVCNCALELPKTDPFSSYKSVRNGVLVMNVRGGCLYLADQFTESSIVKVFPPDQSSIIKNIKLYPSEGSLIDLGHISVRYLNLSKRSKLVGVVLKFVNLSEEQMDTLNDLGEYFPIAGANEEASVPINNVYRRAG